MQARLVATLGIALLVAGPAGAQLTLPDRLALPDSLTNPDTAPLPQPPPEPERWEPDSTTARAITGQVSFTPERITFGSRASLALEPAGEAADFMVDGQRVSATFYKVTVPGNPVLLRGSRLCGNGRPVRLIAVWTPRPIGERAPATGRAFAAFSSQAIPKSADEGELCGTFYYERQQAPAAAQGSRRGR
ncbi:hypothetical protein [Roseicella sp. DB1501]|uniref:hypothetical protein n=1 Tax=Roseicella sp. DB1501 TaxID=2730925 RepID=UPI001490DFF3|nr:hypothetical protein [Roseicella sp. DB1501]NOG71038.1 hypothetical protein [Roseicella sp. DB1501]